MGKKVVYTQNNPNSGGYALIRFTPSAGNESYTLANIAAAGETIQEAFIQNITWSLSSGTLTVQRASNTVFQGAASGSIDFAVDQLRLEANAVESAGNIAITGTVTGTVLIKVKKRSGA